VHAGYDLDRLVIKLSINGYINKHFIRLARDFVWAMFHCFIFYVKGVHNVATHIECGYIVVDELPSKSHSNSAGVRLLSNIDNVVIIVKITSHMTWYMNSA